MCGFEILCSGSNILSPEASKVVPRLRFEQEDRIERCRVVHRMIVAVNGCRAVGALCIVLLRKRSNVVEATIFGHDYFPTPVHSGFCKDSEEINQSKKN